ncbi:MAG: insulinase family protein [Bacteroidales bacterium]
MLNLRTYLVGIITLLLAICSCTPPAPTYESVAGDPMDVRIYTLENGLKVYMSVYKDAPRIQTFIGVRAGSKNDPATSTGLAHYFEHLMFKGTGKMGTKDFSKEEPLLNEIESLFELYRQTTDSLQRIQIYHQIDSISNEASKYAVSNEYDRMMTFIGAQGSNAWTSSDQTVYTENIPANQLENWALIQAERFRDPVIRIFHTELETVYEEKNRSLNSDQSRVLDTLLLALYPHHTYGTQSTLGTDKDLKNPSITNIKNFFKTYYVPNNMAICLSGDFNPDSALAVIRRNFSDLQPKDVPVYKPGTEPVRTEPIIKNVNGLESDMVYIGYRLPGEKENDDQMNQLINFILYNGTAGLLDLNINQQQKMIGSGVYNLNMSDYSTFLLLGYPKEGQPMEEVKNLLLAQIDSVRSGNFGNWLLEAAINNTKLDRMNALTNNQARAMAMIDAFTNNQSWKDYVDSFEKMKKITKQDVVAYANKWFTNDYAVVYKHRTPDFSIPSFPKPTITPVQLDRNSKSNFFQMIEKNSVKPIEPVFVDYQKDLIKTTAQKDIPILYKENQENSIFSLYYVFDMGTANDRRLPIAFNYLNYLGTATLSPEEFKEKMLTLACSFNVIPQTDKTFVVLTGLNENMEAAMKLMEELFSDAQVNPTAFMNVITDELKLRADNKLNYNIINKQLQSYGQWGAVSPSTYVLSNEELQKLTPQDMISLIRSANQFRHQIWYYGPKEVKEVVKKIDDLHQVAGELKEAPVAMQFEQQPTETTTVFLTDYPSKQTSMTLLSRGILYDSNLSTYERLYNNYFQDVAFQEMREARGLAYTVYSGYFAPRKKTQYYMNTSYIGTQNDKLQTAVEHFQTILTDLPESPESFEVTKMNVENQIRTNRITKEEVLWSYYQAVLLGLDTDINQLVFSQLPTSDFFKLKGFHDQYIKGAKYNYCLLGNVNELDMKFVNSIGQVKKLSLEELFGY